MKHLPGVIGHAKETKEVIDCWNLFFTDEIIQNIVGYTNIYIEKISSHYKDRSDCRSTSVHEIRALIGLLYAMGFLHGGRMNIHDFWSTDGLGTECFPVTMALRRFRFLLKCIRFDEQATKKKKMINWLQ